LRVRADFVTRPPRLSESDLESLWATASAADVPYVDARRLIAIKLTNREKDYAVVGELARLLTDPAEQLLFSRSARDIMGLAQHDPDLVATLVPRRPALGAVQAGLDELERALDAERRDLIHQNERRLAGYLEAARAWSLRWPELARTTDTLPLLESHQVLASAAAGVLPFAPIREVG
jgi:hypothetical protein